MFLDCTHKFDRLYWQIFGSECGADAATNRPNMRSTLTRAIDNFSVFW
ncbi:hypothetical protein [Oscillatoria nigro-viridis]|nr:hypothetical protein [Oscillatoria nigro-viridis]